MDFLEILKSVLRRWWVIALVTVISTATAVFLTQFLKDSYKSTAQLATGFTTKNSLSFMETSMSFRDVETNFNNLIHQFRSPQTLYLLAYRLILHDLEEKPFHQPEESPFKSSIDKTLAIDQFKDKLDSMKTLSAYNQDDRYLDSLLHIYGYDVDKIRESLKIWRIGDTDYISIEYYSDSPLLSAFAVNTLIREFLRYYRYTLYQQSKENIAFYNKLVVEMKNRLDDLQTQYNYIKKQNQIIDFSTASESKLGHLTSLEANKEELESRVNALKLSLRDLDSRISSLSSKSSQNIENTRLLRLKNLITKLNEQYINSGMSDKNLLDSINSLRKEYAYEITRIQNTQLSGVDLEMLKQLQNKRFDLETELKIAQSNLARINKRLNEAKFNVSSLAGKESKIRALEDEIELTRQEYLSLKDKLNDIKNQALVMGNNLRQTQFGQPAVEPEPSKKIMLVILGFLAGFFVSTFALIGLELFDLSLKDPDKFQNMVQLPLLGILTKVSLKNYDFPLIFSNVNSKNQQYEYFRQSLRKIRFEIDKKGHKIILVNSTENKEGKTFFILALAFSFNLINKKILIIDTNFKNNTLTKLYLQKQKVKISENKELPQKIKLLNMSNEKGDQNQPETFDQFIMKTDRKGIDLIGSYPGLNSPYEIFSNKRFDLFISEFAKYYDYILLEGPSLNNYSDAKELIEYCDGLIGVFSAEKVLNKIDKESINYYKSLDGKYIGSILNNVEMTNLK